MGKLITLCIAAIMAVSMWADRLQDLNPECSFD